MIPKLSGACYAVNTDTVLIMEAVHTSEMSVHTNETTQCYIPEDCASTLGLSNQFILPIFTLQRRMEYCCVEVLGFGATCIFRSMLTFQINMLSPSSGDEVTRQGSRGVFIGPEEEKKPIRERDQNWMGANTEPSGRLQEGGWV
jgi:hypothetical protein